MKLIRVLGREKLSPSERQLLIERARQYGMVSASEVVELVVTIRAIDAALHALEAIDCNLIGPLETVDDRRANEFELVDVRKRLRKWITHTKMLLNKKS